MDRSSLRAHKVNVYATQNDKDTGNVHATAHLVPYPHKGFDNYEYKGIMYPGYTEPRDTAEACIMLDTPLKGY